MSFESLKRSYSISSKKVPNLHTQSVRQVNRRHQVRDAYPSNAESRRPPPSHLSQLPAIIPDYQHILTNLAFDMNVIGENVLLTRNHSLHSYRNSFNNNRHTPTILQGRLFSGLCTYKYRLFLSMVHKISLMSLRLQMPFGGKYCGRRYKRKNAKTATTVKSVKFQRTNFFTCCQC